VNGFFGEAERLENRFHWVDLLVVDSGEVRMVEIRDGKADNVTGVTCICHGMRDSMC
jgi:hypothetical protein